MLMKKLFTLSMFLLATAWAMAQDSNTFQFVDKDGNVVADGTTITVKDLTEDVFLGNFISTGLSVKNTSTAAASIQLSYNIETIDNGMFQICFPENCITRSEAGEYMTTKGSLNAGVQRDLQCEWFPETYGTCKAHLAIEVLSAFGTKVADGPAVTVIFNYADPSRIENIQQGTVVTDSYNLQGQHAAEGHKGLTISRLSNGKTIKHITK